jgi:hypothetical protein
MESPKAVRSPVQLTFAGKTFVVTGTLNHRTRDEIHAMIEQHGGRPTSSVSKKTDYALRALFTLVENYGRGPIPIRELETLTAAREPEKAQAE